MGDLILSGGVALVDDADLVTIARYSWRIDRDGYVSSRRTVGTRRQRRVSLHRFLMGDPAGMVVDHINRDKLDNRRANLRICTQMQNAKNRANVRGVTRRRDSGKWQAAITADGRQHYLGVFDDVADARAARLAAERKYFGEFAPTGAAT